MTRIKLTPQQVRSVSQEFKNAGNQSDELVRRLEATVNRLAPDFEGMTKEKFYNDFQTWQTSMRQFVQLLESISQQLDAIATRFEEVDRA